MHYKPSRVFKYISNYLNMFVEPVLNCWPLNKLRERALSHILEHIHYEDETTQYIGLCPVTKVFSTIVTHSPLLIFLEYATNYIILLYIYIYIYNLLTSIKKNINSCLRTRGYSPCKIRT
jgi:hypothetical protein